MQQLKRALKLGLSNGLVMLTLAGCPLTTRTQTSVINPACQIYEKIRYSRNDTVDTQKQVREHNAVHTATCG